MNIDCADEIFIVFVKENSFYPAHVWKIISVVEVRSHRYGKF